MPREKEVIILGGGLAGLAAAVVLADEGFQITVLERRPFLGGRASSYPVPNSQRLNSTTNSETRKSTPSQSDEAGESSSGLAQETAKEAYIDNCQHILMKCCTNLLDFYRRLSVDHLITFFDRFTFLDQHGRLATLKGAHLPAPFHLIPSFLQFHPLRWSDKLAVAYGMFCMMRERGLLQELDRTTMLEWLEKHRQTRGAIDVFWRPVLVSALNEQIELASARYGVKVFLDGFLNHPTSFHMGVPKVPLSKLYTEPCLKYLEARGGQVLLRRSAASIEANHSKVGGILMSDGTLIVGDYYLSSVPPDALLKLLPAPLVENSKYFSNLKRFESSPITSIYLWFDRPVTDLENCAILGHEIQWLFKRNDERRGVDQINHEYLALVVSASRRLVTLAPKDIIRLALDDLRAVLPNSDQSILLHSVVLKEPFATFSCRARCDEYRLEQKTPLDNFFVAGDWTKTGWPPTMEGAIRSSYRCAELILKAEGIDRKITQPDLPTRGLLRWMPLI
jgi:squalene-associated FAD-dependent desaturase